MKEKLSSLFTENISEIFDSSRFTLQTIQTNHNSYNQNQIMKDLEILKPINEESIPCIQAINHTYTLSGYDILQSQLCILKSKEKCIQRQKILRSLLNNQKCLQDIRTFLKNHKELERDIYWCLEEKDIGEKEILSSGYFTNTYLQWLNKYPQLLGFLNFFTITLAPLYGILSPVLMILLPYLYVKYILSKFIPSLNVSFSRYYNFAKGSVSSILNIIKGKSSSKFNSLATLSKLLSIVIYVQNVYQNIRISNRVKFVVTHIQEKILNIKKIESLFCSLLQKYPQLKEILLFEQVQYNPCSFTTNNCKKNPYLKNWSSVLFDFSCYTNIIQNGCYMNSLKNLLKSIGILDMLQSTCTLLEDKQWCFPQWISRKKEKHPRILFRNISHPSLKKPVKNDFYTTTKRKDTLITGPNAGGKSTLLKTICTNLYLGQTLGCCCATKAHVSYFDYIFTHIHITDTQGKESLFQAEMNRAYSHIKKIQKAQKENKFCFSIMDEIFSSTNPKEGIAGAWSICETLSEYNNSMIMVTTHFSQLTQLEQQKHIHFQNWQMPIKRTNHKIYYPYIARKGTSEQCIALELLEKNGFDKDILSKANNFVKKLNNI